MLSTVERLFALKAPCGNCPFRKVGAIDLRPGRLQGIIRGLLTDDHSTFHCHKTVHSKLGGTWEQGEEEDVYVPSNKESMCAGAIIYLEKVGRPTVAMRLGRLLGKYLPDSLKPHFDAVIEPGHAAPSGQPYDERR